MSAVAENRSTFAWKEAALGGVISLIVTVLAGLAVWFLTRDTNKAEKVVYRIEPASIFSASSRHVGFRSIVVRNDGLDKATGVVIDVQVPKGLNIIDQSIKFSSGISIPFKQLSSSSGRSILIPTLLPSGRVTVSYLTTGDVGRSVEFIVRTDQQIAQREIAGQDKKRSFSSILVVLTLQAILTSSAWLYLNYRKRGRELRRSNQAKFYPIRNNIGFLLMHNGLYKEAEDIFRADVGSGDAELMTISHLGAVLALQDDASADKYLRSSEWPDDNAHSKANIAIDRFIVNAHRGDVEEARSSIVEAVDLSKAVKPYFKNSVLINEMINKCGLRDFVDSVL